jgi:hypothetical protein
MKSLPDNIESQFPVEIDLGMTAPTTIEISGMGMKKSAKMSKPMYPTLYIHSADNLDKLPKEGYALVYYKRRALTQTENEGGMHTSADLEIQEICAPEMSADEDKSDLESGLKSMAKGMGLDVGDDDEEGEDMEEESMESPEEESMEDEYEEK